jgi:hypothetical protein
MVGRYNRIDPIYAYFLMDNSANNYNFAFNVPIMFYDIYGLDVRIMLIRYIHAYVEIDQWDDECCKVKGSKTYSFGPYKYKLYGPARVIEEDKPGIRIWTCKCGCAGSKTADQLAQKYVTTTPNYNIFTFNCWDFSLDICRACKGAS